MPYVDRESKGLTTATTIIVSSVDQSAGKTVPFAVSNGKPDCFCGLILACFCEQEC